MEQIYWIIRWRDNIYFPDGQVSHMQAFTGTREEAEAHAKEMAEKNHTIVEVIV